MVKIIILLLPHFHQEAIVKRKITKKSGVVSIPSYNLAEERLG
jgi:hypothetical protein